jgi:nitrate reductase alpha subunit
MGFIERYSFFKKSQKSADGFSETRYEDRTWENGYRNRFAYYKVVRSTQVLIAQALAVGKFMLKTALLHTRSNKTITPRHKKVFQNTNHAAAQAGQATQATYTAHTV